MFLICEFLFILYIAESQVKNIRAGGDIITEKKIVMLAIAFFAFAFVIELRLVSIMCGDYYIKAEKNTVRSIDLSTGRADIADCNLNKITGTGSSVKTLVTNQADLQKIYENIRPEDREKFYRRVKQEPGVVVELTSPVASEDIYITSQRYSGNNIAQHLIGYTDGSGDGVAGIERAFNSKLKDNGEKISLYYNINGNGVIYGDIKAEETENPKVLSLTIDNRIQRLRESVAKESIASGSIVIMETATGKIKAMISTPAYDANNLVDYLSAENSPLVNKALQCYEPGSVVKPLWACVLLENGASPGRLYECKGYTEIDGHIYHCANNTVHGVVDMRQALVVSCNCYFIDSYIKDKGLMFRQAANQMGFDDYLQLAENYYTSSATFPSASRLTNTGNLASVSFGQGSFLVSSVHIAAYMNMIANKGVYVTPQIVQGIYDEKTGQMIESLYTYSGKKVISEETAETVKNMLRQVVEEGFHSRAKPENLTAAGKTGTAQTGRKNEDGSEIYTAWFAGFYPADNPKYTIALNMYNGGESAVTAAPVFKKICDELYYLEFAGAETYTE